MLFWQSATLKLSPTLSLTRDDLFRVELDIVAGDEMYYSKVSTIFIDSCDLSLVVMVVIGKMSFSNIEKCKLHCTN